MRFVSPLAVEIEILKAFIVYNFVTLKEKGWAIVIQGVTLILLAAGSSSRFDKRIKKQWLRIADIPLWQAVTNRFAKQHQFNKIIITAHADDISYMKRFGVYEVVEGGADRQASIANALEHVNSEFVLISDVARACVSDVLMSRLLSCDVTNIDCVVPFLPVSDTVILGDKQIDRSEVKRIQTPQLSRTSLLKAHIYDTIRYTDESTLIQSNGGLVHYVQGESDAEKITFASDLQKLSCLDAPVTHQFIGNGFDVHPFVNGKIMMLGGVEIDVPYGFKAHSDGDVAIHALIDALLGAAGIGDIGELFPDTDSAYEGIDSKILLKRCVTLIHRFGFEIINVDITIMAQAPRVSKYKQQMSSVMAEILEIAPVHVNVKATTTEKLGFVGRKEGVAVNATANLKYYNWSVI